MGSIYAYFLIFESLTLRSFSFCLAWKLLMYMRASKMADKYLNNEIRSLDIQTFACIAFFPFIPLYDESCVLRLLGMQYWSSYRNFRTLTRTMG